MNVIEFLNNEFRNIVKEYNNEYHISSIKYQIKYLSNNDHKNSQIFFKNYWKNNPNII